MEASHFALSRLTGRSVIGVLRTLFAGNEGQLVPGNFGPVEEATVAAGLSRGGDADTDLVVATPKEPLTSNPITPRLSASRGTPPLRKRLESISLLLVAGLLASSRRHHSVLKRPAYDDATTNPRRRRSCGSAWSSLSRDLADHPDHPAFLFA
jgi:hypothetical protein